MGEAVRARTLARQAAGYTVVGGLAAVVDIGGFHVLAPRFEQLLLPAVLSFLAAACVNYLLSSVWVYRQPWRSWQRAGAFLFFASIGLVINTTMTLVLAGWAHWPPTLAKAGGVAVAFTANFLMNTFLVFPARAEAGRRPRP